jgi:glycosyltransferase involved in cell wall biosynthesis
LPPGILRPAGSWPLYARNPKVAECLHISEVFERSAEFDLIHNHFDFLPLTYSLLIDTPVLTTIHGFSSPTILPVYKKYNAGGHYVAISEADKSPELDYVATIHHGIDISKFHFSGGKGEYLLFFGRIHPEKGVHEAIQVAQRAGKKLVIAGIVQDREYFESRVEPYLDGDRVEYLGVIGPAQRSDVLGRAVALLHLISFEEPFGLISFEEPFGLSLVEAMACGTPVIAFGRGSIPEIIMDGKTGFIVEDVEQAVQAVAKVRSLDRSACREDVEQRFSQTRMVSDYMRVYREILKMEASHEE